ncbi:type II toxin-antitoxin system VapC family toxin [Porticoccus sp. GXU_MW_L64]
MTAIDTNIIVRLLTRDSENQYQLSYQLFSTESVFIPDTVILETEWVLRFAYEFQPVEVCTAFRKLFGLANVQLNNNFIVAQAIDWHEQGMDFADAFHLALSHEQNSLATFDEKFIRQARGLSRCHVQKPKE